MNGQLGMQWALNIGRKYCQAIAENKLCLSKHHLVLANIAKPNLGS
jgi:hypothetical protein